MRIAFLSPLPPEQNGIADYAQAFCQAMESASVKVFTPFRGKPLSAEPGQLYQQMSTVDWRDVDLVHVELGGGRSSEYLALQWLEKCLPDMPVTATVHDPDRLVWKPTSLPAWLKRLPRSFYQALVLLLNPLTLADERRTAARLSGMVTLTATGAEALTRRMRLPHGKVRVMAHGNAQIPATPLPTLPGIGPLKLLYFGFIYRGKGIEDLVDALAILVGNNPAVLDQIELTLAGGTQPDMAFGHRDDYLDSLRQRLQAQGLSRLRANWQLDIAPAAIPALVQAHHVMILPYRESARLSWLGQMRGTSGALSWAAACGRSVIASDARAFAEEVSYGNGTVYPQGDCTALANEILYLLTHPESLEERSHAAQRLGDERGWPHVAEQFRHMFLQLAKRSTA